MPTVEASSVATFDTDDKRAQYARLVVFNHGVKEKIISKDKDVNTVSNTDLQKAFKSITGGTLLKGKEGLAFLIELTKKGATDDNVAKRGLTTAYAQEVRPFITRGLLAANFGRRATTRAAGNGGETRTSARSGGSRSSAKSGAAKKSTAKKSQTKKSSAKKTSSRKNKTAQAPPPVPAAEETATA